MADTQTAGEGLAVENPRPFSWTLAVQLIAYAVLVVLALLPGGRSLDPTSLSFSFTTTAVVAMIVIFAFFDPLRDGVPGRIIALVAGFASMVFATTPWLGNVVFDASKVAAQDGQNAADYLMPQAWLVGAGVLLVLLIVAGFVRQMARKDRSNLIMQLSDMVLDGVASILCAGWCFFPYLFTNTTVVGFGGSSSLHVAWLLGVIAVVLVAVALAFASHRWKKEAQPYPGAHSP